MNIKFTEQYILADNFSKVFLRCVIPVVLSNNNNKLMVYIYIYIYIYIAKTQLYSL